MKIINNINFYNQILLFLIYLNSATILVPDKYKAWPIGLLLVTTIVRYLKLNDKPVLESKKFAISIGFFIILFLSIVYTSDIAFAFKKLETGGALFVFPLIFYIISKDKVLFTKKNIQILKLTFIFSLIFFLVITFWYFYFTEPFYTFKSTLVHYTNLVNIRIEHYEIHSIYLSIYIGIAIIFVLSIIKDCSPTLKKALCFALLILIIFTAILNKKGPIISLGIIGVVFLLKRKFDFKQSIYFFLASITLILFIIYVPKYNNVNRFKELFNFESNKESSTTIRLQIYECAIEKISKSPVFGYGWGDTKDILNDCYLIKNKNLLNRNYNSHNQFLSILLSTGVLGFIAFVYYLFYIFKTSKKIESELLFFLTLYFCLNMLTENILEREDGVIVIALFTNILLFGYNKERGVLNNKT